MHIVQLLSNPELGGTETFALSLARELTRQGQATRIVNLCGISRLEALAQEAGVAYEGMDMPAFYDVAGIRNVHRRILNDAPDIVMAYGLRASLFLRTLAFRRQRPLLVTALRGLDGWRRWYHVWVDRWTEGGVDCFVGNSRAVCEVRQRREGTLPARIACIPNGIDT
jgi:glycosyltransferase involved in cell wall biosynthesis